MKKKRNNQDRPATRRDIMELRKTIEKLFPSENEPSGDKAHTAEWFSKLTGLKYIDVIELCVKGTLKAYYNGSTWMVYESELDKSKLINISCRRHI